MKTGWLINDTLTCIPNTKTFWHDLLDWLPNLIDKTNGYTAYSSLPNKIELDYSTINNKPEYLIRNASFFRRMNIPIKTISLLQDVWDEPTQLDVCNNSSYTVFNSPFTYELYKDKITSRFEVIPLGTDFNLFQPLNNNFSDEFGILPNSICFIGANNDYPKGFNTILDLINSTNYNFCLIMKDSFEMNHPRVKVFNRMSQENVVKILNSCEMLCTSRIETLHLSGVEAAACNLPLITTNVGVYYNKENGDWGRKASTVNEFKENIEFVFNNYNSFNPREHFLKLGYDKSTCKNKWVELVNKIENE
jgi:glycosyltransferase involved in cell wall biosynthesis